MYFCILNVLNATTESQPLYLGDAEFGLAYSRHALQTRQQTIVPVLYELPHALPRPPRRSVVLCQRQRESTRFGHHQLHQLHVTELILKRMRYTEARAHPTYLAHVLRHSAQPTFLYGLGTGNKKRVGSSTFGPLNVVRGQWGLNTGMYALTYSSCPLMARQVLKVAVVGEEGTGKSCIIARYVEGRFLRTTKPTTGADLSATHVTVNKQDYLYQIWTDMSGCILVYDVTNASSFQFLDALRGKVYRESSREDIPLILVGNKADLEPQGREVPTKQALAWCEDKSIPFFETSARSGAGLHTVFQLLAEQAVEFYNKRHIDVVC